MSNHYAYVYSDTGYFALVSDRELSEPNLTLVPSIPPKATERWDGNDWIPLSETEIKDLIEEAEEAETPSDFESLDISTPTNTNTNSLVLWGNERGDLLVNSSMVVRGSKLEIPYDLNLINKKYLINGKNINPIKDEQETIAINQKKICIVS